MSPDDLSSSDDLSTLLGNIAFLDEMYARFQQDPSTVDPSWRRYFDGQTAAASTPAPYTNGHANGTNGHTAGTNGYAVTSSQATPVVVHALAVAAQRGASPAALDFHFATAVSGLVDAYRTYGHFEANLDPLGLLKREPRADLDPKTYGLTDADLERVVPSGVIHGAADTTLGELLRRLRLTYCRSIGLEYMHISSQERRLFLAERMEKTLGNGTLPAEVQKRVLEKLASADIFERFLHNKYVGTKRFSLEGGETLIPLLDLVLENAGELGIVEAVVGMAHRGRLNVLHNIMGKSAQEMFAEFEDIAPQSVLGSGDVKYHLGFSSDHKTAAGKSLHLSLTFNPSHLEAVDPVVIGRVRGKQRRRNDLAHRTVMGVLIHGDAAFAGQGLVAETLNLSELHGYRTGGTVHIIVNNQIGFTTAPHESRSTPYATDVAKMLQCPIFHVNGEDCDAVAHVVQHAMEYRARFHQDVVIDMFCYRKFGHNEADEPSFTQPLLYKRIQEKVPMFRIYADQLVSTGVVTAQDVVDLEGRISGDLENQLKTARQLQDRPRIPALGGVWEGYQGGSEKGVPDIETGVALARLGEITDRVTTVPEGFVLNPKLVRLFKQRLAMGRGEQPVDWGMGEILAYASLLWDGRLVRLSGQDSGRGTFSHRHAIVVDANTGDEYCPLAHLHAEQGEARIYDSALSEAAVLGFEYGYALDWPDGLVIWEAQFGDFVNGAQVILDQFLASSEDKWKRLCGLTLFLPHGYEGQGPEHSSARFERFLQLAAEDNIQVVQPTTPAQMFHLLRRQVFRKWKKPLVVLTPKSLLRLAAATSSIDEFTKGQFQRVIPDATAPKDTDRVFFCSGKVYYDLVEERKKRGDEKTAIVRLEQIYPWREEAILEAVAGYKKLKEIVWVQDEPANMGAYTFVEGRLRAMFPKAGFRAAQRVESASPATGSAKAHAIEHRQLMDEAFHR